MIVGLDIGTTKIAAIVGALHPDGSLEILGMGTHRSEGLRKGMVVNIQSTVESIKRAVEEAEIMAECEIGSVSAGIAGSHILGKNSHGIIAIRTGEVTAVDIDRVLDAAKAIAIPSDHKILHTLPQEYLIDNQEGILEPLGMAGVRLEAKVHIVTGMVSAAQNIVKCIRKCGLEAEDIVLEQLASSYSVLTKDEKELGVCMIDIGGGTTDIAVFTGGSIRHTAVIAVAGDQVTNDIAVFLRTPTEHAEEIKVKYACAISEMVDPNDEIAVPSIGERRERKLRRQALAEVVGPRYEELFTLVQAELRKSGFENRINAGFVLTGGSSKMEGAIELAEGIFHKPVRLGIPRNVDTMIDIVKSPIHATGVGLLIHAVKERQRRDGGGIDGSKKSVWERMRRWFSRNL